MMMPYNSVVYCLNVSVLELCVQSAGSISYPILVCCLGCLSVRAEGTSDGNGSPSGIEAKA